MVQVTPVNVDFTVNPALHAANTVLLPSMLSQVGFKAQHSEDVQVVVAQEILAGVDFKWLTPSAQEKLVHVGMVQHSDRAVSQNVHAVVVGFAGRALAQLTALLSPVTSSHVTSPHVSTPVHSYILLGLSQVPHFGSELHVFQNMSI